MGANGEGDEFTPRQTREIENNLLLKQAIIEIRSIKGIVDTDHLTAIELRDKKTIAHVDTMWGALTNGRWLLAAIAGLLGGLYVTKSLWNWP